MDRIDELDKKLQSAVKDLTLQYIDDVGSIQHIGTYHTHLCAFEMIYTKKYATKLCQNYLATKGMKRDKCLSCCDNADEDGCKYMKMIMFDSSDNIISVI